ncbi:MAG: NUDIX domain-containing protein [Lachnospiraceae bacterium]|nr:NUDIX domain-containing protein [Lachnospiraceae bacterium]
MKHLFDIDNGDYTEDMPLYERFRVRAVIVKDDKIAVQHVDGGEYKLPGGGVEAGETLTEALAREVMEECGLTVIPESIRDIGEVRELRRDIFEPDHRYISHSYHFFCEVKDEISPTAMTESELKRGYHPQWESVDNILAWGDANLGDRYWQKRDHLFLKWMRENHLL